MHCRARPRVQRVVLENIGQEARRHPKLHACSARLENTVQGPLLSSLWTALTAQRARFLLRSAPSALTCAPAALAGLTPLCTGRAIPRHVAGVVLAHTRRSWALETRPFAKTAALALTRTWHLPHVLDAVQERSQLP